MRKKKEKQSTPQVQFSNEELIPSVIGIIDDKEKSSWPLILIFILLIGFVVGLPTITNYLNNEKNHEDKIISNDKKPDHVDETPTEDVPFYSFSDTKSIQIEGISFQEFKLEEKQIELQITNHSESKNYLINHKLYLELYDKDKMLLQRIKLPSENLSKGNTETYSFLLTVPKSQIIEFRLEEKKEDDYPSIDLKKENDSTYYLDCTKDNEKLTYQFNEEQKLQRITEIFNYPSSKSDYSKYLTDYRQTTSQYNALEGVTSNIVEVANGFTVTTILDLSKVDMKDRVVQNTLKNVAYYGKDTEGKVVYFELSAMNYNCSR